MHKKIMRWQDIGSEPHNRKKIKIFLVCLALSFVFWISIKLSRENASQFEIEVKLESIPENIIIAAQSDYGFRIHVQATGMRLLNLHLRQSNQRLDSDFGTLQSLRRNENTYYYLTRRQAELRFSGLFDIPQDALRAEPDTLLFRVETAFTKKVPIIPQTRISFRPGFKQYNIMQLYPDSVKIKGPLSLRDSINHLITDSLIATQVDKVIEKELRLFAPNHGNDIELNVPTARIKIPVQEFTEERIELPIEIDCKEIRPPSRIMIFPDKANLHYLVALKDMRNIGSEMFSIQAECPDSISWARHRLRLHPMDKPDKVEILRIVPSEVEFIIISD